MLFVKLAFNLKISDMWFFVEKNGKAIRRYKSKERAILYAQNELDFDSVYDCVAVVDSNGDYVWEL